MGSQRVRHGWATFIGKSMICRGKIVIQIITCDHAGWGTFWSQCLDTPSRQASKAAQSCPALRPRGLWPTRLLRPRDLPGKNTGVGCHFLLQGIFPTQGSNPGLPHCRQRLYLWATREAPSGCYNKVLWQKLQMWSSRGPSIMSSNYIAEANRKENNQCRILSSQFKLWWIYAKF